MVVAVVVQGSIQQPIICINILETVRFQSPLIVTCGINAEFLSTQKLVINTLSAQQIQMTKLGREHTQMPRLYRDILND